MTWRERMAIPVDTASVCVSNPVARFRASAWSRVGVSGRAGRTASLRRDPRTSDPAAGAPSLAHTRAVGAAGCVRRDVRAPSGADGVPQRPVSAIRLRFRSSLSVPPSIHAVSTTRRATRSLTKSGPTRRYAGAMIPRLETTGHVPEIQMVRMPRSTGRQRKYV